MVRSAIYFVAQASQLLAESAMVEALSIVAEARMLAILEAGFDCGTGVATGTGTDCVVITAPHSRDRPRSQDCIQLWGRPLAKPCCPSAGRA